MIPVAEEEEDDLSPEEVQMVRMTERENCVLLFKKVITQADGHSVIML